MSSPEEDHLSILLRCGDPFSAEVAKQVGSSFEITALGSAAQNSADHRMEGDEQILESRTALPHMCLVGPLGNTSEEVFKYEASVLVGGGEGFLSFVSIIKSAWYRIHYPQHRGQFRKLFFVWVCKDVSHCQWFRSLCMAVEAQDLDRRIEVHTYMTGRTVFHDSVSDITEEVDMGFIKPTVYGRPDWDMVFQRVQAAYPCREIAVFAAGPPGMCQQVYDACTNQSNVVNEFLWKTDLM
ncbi:MAG: NADPH oxidase 3 [Vezdaea aestivalis]|nr:MAG: NADPH oxidase 3 [Vezdaea aestivalis]